MAIYLNSLNTHFVPNTCIAHTIRLDVIVDDQGVLLTQGIDKGNGVDDVIHLWRDN